MLRRARIKHTSLSTNSTSLIEIGNENRWKTFFSAETHTQASFVPPPFSCVNVNFYLGSKTVLNTSTSFEMPMIRASGKEGISICFSLRGLNWNRENSLFSLLPRQFPRRRKIDSTFPRGFRGISALRSSSSLRRSLAFSTETFLPGKSATSGIFFSVSRLNEAQQQYDKCVNMQIVNLFPLTHFFRFDVCDNISFGWYLCSRLAPRASSLSAIWCRAFMARNIVKNVNGKCSAKGKLK